MRRSVLLLLCLLPLAACSARPPAAGPPTQSAPGHLLRATARPVISSPLVADLDGDGQPEIAVGSWDGYFYVMDDQLRDKPGWPRYSPQGFLLVARGRRPGR